MLIRTPYIQSYIIPTFPNARLFMYLSKVFVKFVVDLIIQVTIRVFVDNQIYKINSLNIDVKR